jgi:hypothetical protein
MAPLNSWVVGPHQRPARHVGVDLLGQADTELDALALLDLGAALEQVVPRLRTVRHADGLPQALAVVPGVGHPAGGERVELVGVRVEARLLAQLELLAVPLAGLLRHVGHVLDAGLELGQGRDVLDQVVTLAGLNLRGDAGRDLGVVDVVDRHVDADLLPPVLGERAEPLVVTGNEVAPQQDAKVPGQLGAGFSEGRAGCRLCRLLRLWGRLPAAAGADGATECEQARGK